MERARLALLKRSERIRAANDAGDDAWNSEPAGIPEAQN